MSGCGWVALPDVREWSVDNPKCLETFPDVQEWSGGPLGCPRVVGRPSRMSESGWEALSDVREWLGGPPGCPRVVGMFSRMSEWSGGPP